MRKSPGSQCLTLMLKPLRWLLKALCLPIKLLRQRRECLLRRSCFYVGRWYRWRALVCLLVAILSGTWGTSMGGSKTFVSSECVLGSGAGIGCPVPPCEDLTQAENMLWYTGQTQQAVICVDDVDTFVDSLCSPSILGLTAFYMYFGCAVFVLDCLLCFIVSWAFGSYADANIKSLYKSKLGYKDRLRGYMVMNGPTWVRWYQTINWMFVFAGLGLTGLHYWQCGVSNKMSEACGSVGGDCVYNQVKNCRYFGDPVCDPFREPLDFGAADCGKQYAKFSGIIDVRLLYHTPCERCRALFDDSKSASATDFLSFKVVDPEGDPCLTGSYVAMAMCPSHVPSSQTNCTANDLTAESGLTGPDPNLDARDWPEFLDASVFSQIFKDDLKYMGLLLLVAIGTQVSALTLRPLIPLETLFYNPLKTECVGWRRLLRLPGDD